MESARNTARLGPAKAPSSSYHIWNNNSGQLLAIAETTLCSTSENSSGPSGSPCWTPDSEEPVNIINFILIIILVIRLY